LEGLGLQRNTVTGERAASLCRGLATHAGLHTLFLFDNLEVGGRTVGVAALATALAANSAMRLLRLGNTGITDARPLLILAAE